MSVYILVICNIHVGVNRLLGGTTGCDHGGCTVQVAGHCFTTTGITQTFAKKLILGLNIIFLGLMLALVKFGLFPLW